MSWRFEVLATCGAARRGRLVTPHGVIETPAFMPVGTLGAVKGLTPDQLEATGASIMLANLYHLSLRPGIETIAELGGIHAFTGWSRPILTDSGGFQVWSLAKLRKLDSGGVSFRSHLDGSLLRFTPENVVMAQQKIGVDIAMMLDDCTAWPATWDEANRSLNLTLSWAEKARRAWDDKLPGGLFAICQGSAFEDLRLRAAATLTELDCHGYAIGGVSVGETDELRRRAVVWTAPALPADKPRYLMGLGTPLDILHGVQNGVDLFDCVMPARNARHGMLFTRSGPIRIKNARYKNDPTPLDPESGWPPARTLSRALVHHLFKAGEITALVIGTQLNIRFYLDFMADLREGAQLGILAALAEGFVERYRGAGDPSPSI